MRRLLHHRGQGITVDGFGACSPTPCEFGRIAGTVFGPNVSATIGTSIAAQWDFKFKRTVLLATYSAPKRVATLTVQEFNTFTDGSGRANYTVTETFHKGKAVKVTKTSVSASDYPLGDPVSPAVTLPAICINTAATGSVRAVILSLAPGRGLLAVHAYGFCSPVPCNWGTVTGITFGPTVVATTGGTFLARSQATRRQHQRGGRSPDRPGLDRVHRPQQALKLREHGHLRPAPLASSRTTGRGPPLPGGPRSRALAKESRDA